MSILQSQKSVLFTLFAIVALFTLGSQQPAQANGHQSKEAVYWWWDYGGSNAGDSKLVRTPHGISANFKTSGLPAGHAMTLWFIVFNNPAECATDPCGGGDLFNPAVGGDFLFAGGHIANGNKTTISGHLSVGDASGSGFHEFGLPALAIGLSNPMGAEVHLALHSHGPAATGQVLAAQISSYFGGCVVLLGPDGFAASDLDVPQNDGECSTIQVSIHQP